jgi:hypothetical protein
MGAFDRSFKPKALTPGSTTEATLFTAGTDSTAAQDCQVVVDISNISTATATARVGILPVGGSVHWKIYDDPVAPDNPLIGVGPWFLQAGDIIRVRTSVANALTFSVTGTNSSA